MRPFFLFYVQLVVAVTACVCMWVDALTAEEDGEDATFILNNGTRGEPPFVCSPARQVAILLRRSFVSIYREKVI